MNTKKRLTTHTVLKRNSAKKNQYISRMDLRTMPRGNPRLALGKTITREEFNKRFDRVK